MKIKGTVNYQNLSGGFWGVTDEKGKNWQPIEMPEDLKKEGLKVVLNAKKAAEGISFMMWGTSIEILKFEIV